MSDSHSTPIALQLYSLRHYADNFAGICDGAKEAGFEAVELVALDMSGAEAKAILDERGLRAISAHMSVAHVEERFEETVRFHREVGNDTLIIASPDKATRDAASAEAWSALGKKLNELGQRCREEGMALGYHNHWFEMERFGERRAIELIFDACEPDHLFWEPDLAWIAKGDADPLELLHAFTGRCPYIHAKDLAPAGENEDQHGVADVGYGVLDWEVLIPASFEAGAKAFVVEHDLPADPVFNVGRSLKFLQKRLEK